MTVNTPVSDGHGSGGSDSRYYVLGGGQLGAAVARRLRAAGHAVRVVDETHDRSDPEGYRGDPADPRTLKEAGIELASAVVVATESDSRNLLIAQLVRTHFEVRPVVVLANSPERRRTFAAVGHDPVCATTALSQALVDAL